MLWSTCGAAGELGMGGAFITTNYPFAYLAQKKFGVWTRPVLPLVLGKNLGISWTSRCIHEMEGVLV